MRVPALRVVSAVLFLFAMTPFTTAAQSVLVEARSTSGDEVATIRTDSMRLLVPLHLLVGGLLFPDGTLQTTAAGGTNVTSAEIVDGTIVDADISASAGIADTKLGTISSAGKVANAATSATSVNAPDAIVARDAAGGFSAGYVAAADSLSIRGHGSFVATGTMVLGTTALPPASGAGTRMLWYPEKAAFRAGWVSGTQWDADNVGTNSMAFGYNTTASYTWSTAFGNQTSATGSSSTAFGYQTTASGNTATAFGGYGTASGTYATAFGYNTLANGVGATALGYSTTATGRYATAMGSGTSAPAYASLVIGRANVAYGTAGSWDAADPLFVAGNGTPGVSTSNALTLYKNGNLTIAGSLTESSDARLKESIEPLDGVLDRVLRLTPIRYRFRAGTGRPQSTQIGLTAQQVQPLFPELVARDGDGYLSLSYANLSAVLVKAAQEQQAEIDPLQAEMKALRMRNLEMQSEIEQLRAANRELSSQVTALQAARQSAETRVSRLEGLVEQLLAAPLATTRNPALPDLPR